MQQLGAFLHTDNKQKTKSYTQLFSKGERKSGVSGCVNVQLLQECGHTDWRPLLVFFFILVFVLIYTRLLPTQTADEFECGNSGGGGGDVVECSIEKDQIVGHGCNATVTSLIGF